MSKLVIVGAGIAGLSSALYAAEKGHEVTVLERASAESENCSYGNAGMIVPSHFIPLAAPGVMRLALRWMWNRESPFWLRPRLDRELIRWGRHFRHAATPLHVAQSAPLLRDLHFASRAAYVELAREADDFGLTERGILMLCRTREGIDEEILVAEHATKLDIPCEVLSASDVAKLEPKLRMKIRGGVLYEKDATLDPARLMTSLKRRAADRGVVVSYDSEVRGWRVSGDAIEAVKTARGDVTADEFVIAGGSWSSHLVRDLGVHLPMQAGKGYSLTIPAPPQRPARGLILSEGRVAITPMGEKVRFGGTMEIAGLDETIHPARLRGIVKSVIRYFPDYSRRDFDGVTPWSGLRPCSPDGLPYIGRFRRFANLTAATGHAMMGISLGPITGKLVAEIVSGEPPSIDIDRLSPERFEGI
ncbi:MAG: FAD-dependent oxidoreductase [Thermoanaerobaculia bacterium]